MSWKILYNMRKNQRLHRCFNQFFLNEVKEKENVGENVLNAKSFFAWEYVCHFSWNMEC